MGPAASPPAASAHQLLPPPLQPPLPPPLQPPLPPQCSAATPLPRAELTSMADNFLTVEPADLWFRSGPGGGAATARLAARQTAATPRGPRTRNEQCLSLQVSATQECSLPADTKEPDGRPCGLQSQDHPPQDLLCAPQRRRGGAGQQQGGGGYHAGATRALRCAALEGSASRRTVAFATAVSF